MKHFGWLVALTAVLPGIFLSSPALSQTEAVTTQQPAIGGYSPVSYFTENKAELGSPEFAVEYDGSVYYLSSQEQVDLFEANPDMYRPRYKSCPYSLALGKVLPLDPTNFKIVGNNLLLFHLSENEDSLKLWNESKISDEELMRQADANLFLVKF